mgnify:CR=1 FL=1
MDNFRPALTYTKEDKNYLKYRYCDCFGGKCKCSETEREISGRKVLEGIPSRGQELKEWCAWVSAQMVLEYYGYQITPEEIGRKTYRIAGSEWEGAQSGLEGRHYSAYEQAIRELGQDTLELEWYTYGSTDESADDEALRVILDAIENSAPVLIMADHDWTGLDPWDNPKIGHVSVLVGYSLNSREGLVKEAPFVGVSPPSIRFHDPANFVTSGGVGLGTYWINYFDVFSRTTRDGGWLELIVVRRR